MDDNTLIALFFARNEEALRQTADKYGGALMTLARRILRDKEDAEECVSDTYLTAWNTIPPQKPTHFYAYLAKICRFTAFDRLDKANAQKRTAQVVTLSAELESCLPAALSTLGEEELGRLLNSFLAELPVEKRRIFLRRYWFGDSVREIAVRYHISESKVKVTLFRLRGQLKLSLEKEGISV